MEAIGDNIKAIRKLLSKKADLSLIFSTTLSDYTTPIYPPLELGTDENWVIGLLSLETYYSFSNINNTNNIFKYSIDNGITWKTITLPPGAYEIEQINSEIKRLMLPDVGIEILVNTVTLGSIVDITAPTYRVDFTVANSISSVLGFNPQILTEGYNVSDTVVNILDVNTILVNCNIVNNSYLKGSHAPILYSFFPNVKPGRKIVKEPSTIAYLAVNQKYIPNIRIWLTDQDENIIDFRGEVITYRLHMKQL